MDSRGLCDVSCTSIPTIEHHLGCAGHDVLIVTSQFADMVWSHHKTVYCQGVSPPHVCMCVCADACQLSPARLPAGITVAASDKTDTRWTSSNYGSCVDLYAPGVAVLSAMDTSDTATMTASGTSMACPHVSGVAALYLQSNPTAQPNEVKSNTSCRANTPGFCHRECLHVS